MKENYPLIVRDELKKGDTSHVIRTATERKTTAPLPGRLQKK